MNRKVKISLFVLAVVVVVYFVMNKEIKKAFPALASSEDKRAFVNSEIEKYKAAFPNWSDKSTWLPDYKDRFEGSTEDYVRTMVIENLLLKGTLVRSDLDKTTESRISAEETLIGFDIDQVEGIKAQIGIQFTSYEEGLYMAAKWVVSTSKGINI